MLDLLQVFFTHLYKGGSNNDRGTLVQLRNLINRRNVANDVSGRFIASIDFFELVTKCHIVAAAMDFFGMNAPQDEPTTNTLPQDILLWPDKKSQWRSFSFIIGRMVDRYIIVRCYTQLKQKNTIIRQPTIHELSTNPHVQRVAAEHMYITTPAETSRSSAKHRQLPPTVLISDQPRASLTVQEYAPDSVHNYACAVLNDGMLMLEFRDAIHEGDGNRILRVWKFLLLHFRYAGRKKYALEAFHQLAADSVVSPRLAAQMKWSRVVNTRGGAGNNLPVDLFMEHLNRSLKDYVKDLGANISKETILQRGKSLKGIYTVCSNFDETSEIHAESLHHTTKSSQKDEEIIIKEQSQTSRVFDYIPGRKHRAFETILPNISHSINANKLFKWLQNQKKKLVADIAFKHLVGQ